MSTTAPFTTVLLDMDGTVVDSADVVMRAFSHVISDMGLPEHSREQLFRYVGPPLWESFADLGLSGEDLDRAVTDYRTVYRTMFLEPPLFDGVLPMLEALHSAGVALATATSKQEYMARDQIVHLGIDPLFNVIAGATPDPACTKETVVRDALARLETAGADVSRPVLVGDRRFDVEGGAAVGIPVIGAAWGYAQPGEFDGAIAVANTPAEVVDLVLGRA